MTIRDTILEPYLMIRASAGSGKTYQLSNRIIGMIGAREQAPERIIALTFTRKAAGEFADDLLHKLSRAALDDEAAADLQEQVNGVFDVESVLAQVVRALPRMQLGTMDSFFSQVVRGFQYEFGLSGGDFELIEGPQLEMAMKEIVREALSDVLAEGSGEEFVRAFRRATKGGESGRVAASLEKFVGLWHGLWKAGGDEIRRMARFGGRHQLGGPQLPGIGQWEQEKHRLVSAMRAELEAIDEERWTNKSQKKALLKLCEKIEEHTVGSGVLKKGNSGLFPQILKWIQAGGPPVFSHYKEFELSQRLADCLKEAVELLAQCETAAAIERTEGIGHLIKRVHALYDQRIKSRSLLSFDDVKILMGAWQADEGARLQRELVDYRLDGTYDHWFLDEFQDTSQEQWDGLKPLLDEVSSDPDGVRSLFIIGDTKQAIYGWRGGEVGLFEEAQKWFGMKDQSMDKSYRSCGAVLKLVNAVCCNHEMIGQLFGSAVEARWDCNEHTPADAKKTGEAGVEIVPADEMLEALKKRLVELDIGNRKLSCGILVRTRDELQDVADHLRLNGFDVIEDGRRKPMEDSPIGVALGALIDWLADPADPYVMQVVGMSPLEGVLQERFDDSEVKGVRWKRWETLLEEAHTEGFAAMTRKVLKPLLGKMPAFGKRRSEDILLALENFDRSGSRTARGARDWLAALEIAQPPSDGSIQVMTIHSSKGLGFDVVMLPIFNNDQVPARNRYKVAQSLEGWILQAPAAWVRDMTPDLRDLEIEWVEEQRYEALCLLYVALTRAKRSLNVFLPEESARRTPEEAESWASPANLIRQSIPEEGFHEGDPAWVKETELRKKPPVSKVVLGDSTPICERSTPSLTKGSISGFSAGRTGKKIGSEVHALFEGVSWLEAGEIPRMPRSRAGIIVEETLANAEIHALFEKGEGETELHREQALEVMQDGKWLSGIVDRMHLRWGGDEEIEEITVIDFKTDAASVEEIRERYAGQMECYRRALGSIFGVEEAQIQCLVVATSHKSIIDLSS